MKQRFAEIAASLGCYFLSLFWLAAVAACGYVATLRTFRESPLFDAAFWFLLAIMGCLTTRLIVWLMTGHERPVKGFSPPQRLATFRGPTYSSQWSRHAREDRALQARLCKTLKAGAAGVAQLAVIYLLVWAASLLAIPDTRHSLRGIASNELNREVWEEIFSISTSPSGVMASLIAAAACGAAVIWRMMMGGGPLVDPRRLQLQAVLVTGVLAAAASLAWFQAIDFADGAWLVAAGVAFFGLVALLPMVLATSLSLRRDFQRRCSSVKLVGFARYEEFDVAGYPRPAEFALWTLLLFPIYPLLSSLSLRAASSVFLMTLSAAAIGASAWAVWRFVEWEAIEIWLAVALALLIAIWIYLCGRRLASRLFGSLGLARN